MIKYYSKAAEFPVNHPWLTLLAVFCFLIVSTAGLNKLIVTGDFESILDKDDPLLVDHYRVKQDFVDSKRVVVAIHSPQKSIFTAETIGFLQKFTEQAWSTPFASRVDSLTNYQHTQADGDNLLVGDLFADDVVITRQLLKAGESIALQEPSLRKQFISLDSRTTTIAITFRLPSQESYVQDRIIIMQYVDELIETYRLQRPDLEFYVMGSVVLDERVSNYITNDNRTLIPLMLLLMLVLLWVFLKSASAMVAGVITVIATGASSIGLIGWTGLVFDSIAAISPIVIMTLAIADVTHVSTGTLLALNNGTSQRDAIKISLRNNFYPVFITSLTTVLGVITFVFAESPSMRNLGIFVAIGVVVAFLLSVTLLPAMLALWPIRSGAQKRYLSFSSYFRWLVRNQKTLLPAAIVFSVVLSLLVPKNILNESSELFFQPWTEERASLDFMREHLAGPDILDIALYTDQPDIASKPEFLTVLDEFKQWLMARQGVEYVLSVSDTFKRLNRSMHGDDPNEYKLPVSQNLSAQYLLLYELSLPYGLDLTQDINFDKSAVRLSASLAGMLSKDKIALKYDAIAWLTERAPYVDAVITGNPYINEELTLLNLLPSLLKGGSIAILMVSFVLLLILRSFKLGFIGLLANLLPVFLGYGVWALINGYVNFGALTVAGICLGVVVDFSVHFLTKYRASRLAGNSAEDSVGFAFEKVGYPLLTTTIVLVSGFWLLSFSSINSNAVIGALTGIVILMALFINFVLLPCLLLKWDQHSAYR